MELIFVAVAIAVLVLAVAPSLQGQWRRLHEERLAFDVARELRTARTLAIAQSQIVQWTWDVSARQRWLALLQDDGSTIPVPGRWGRRVTVPERVTLTVVREDQAVTGVTFFPDGTSESTTLTVGTDQMAHYTITVYTATGQVTVHAASSTAG